MLRIFDNTGELHKEVVFLKRVVFCSQNGEAYCDYDRIQTNGGPYSEAGWYSSIWARHKNFPIINLMGRSIPDA